MQETTSITRHGALRGHASPAHRVALQRRAAAALVAVAALVGLTGAARADEMPSGSIAVGPPSVTVVYACDGGAELVATYEQDDSGSAVVAYKGRTYDLPHAPSGSGARYAKDEVELWSKGAEATFSAPGVKLHCREKK